MVSIFSLGPVLLGILLHLGVGLFLLAGVLAAGIGILTIGRRYLPTELPPAEYFGAAYIAGLMWLTLVSQVTLIAGVSVMVPLLLIIPSIIGARLSLSPLTTWRWFAEVALLASPALLFPLRAGLEWHGPTAELNGQTFGDTTTYIAQTFSAQVQAWPLRDLRNDGFNFGPLNVAPALIGASLAWIPGFDAFLLFAVLFPSFGILGVIAAVVVQAPADRRATAVVIVIAAGLLSVAVPYLDWIVESPPVALSLPVIPAFASLLAAKVPSFGRAITLATLGVVASLLGKVLLLPWLAGIALATVLPGNARRHWRWLLAAAGSVSLVAAGALWIYSPLIAAVLDLRFLPLEAVTAALVTLDYSTVQALAWRLAEVSAIAAASRRLSPQSAMLVASGILAFWAFPAFTLVLRMAVFVLIATDFVARPDDQRGKIFAAIAGAGGLLAVVLFAGFPWDYGLAGWTQLVLAPRALYVIATAIGFSAAVVGIRRPLSARKRIIKTGLACVALATLLWSVAYQPRLSAPFTPALADIWEAVDEKTAVGTVLFTDQTGPGMDMLQAYNGFAAIGRRQLFVAGWLNSPLMFDEGERERRLTLNAGVLAGQLSPSEVAPNRFSYAVVVSSAKAVPPMFHLLYSNEQYKLYTISTAKASNMTE